MAVRNTFRGLLLSDCPSPPRYLFGPPATNGKVTGKMPSSDKWHKAVLDLMMWIYFLMVIERCLLLSQQLYSISPSQLDFLFLCLSSKLPPLEVDGSDFSSRLHNVFMFLTCSLVSHLNLFFILLMNILEFRIVLP